MTPLALGLALLPVPMLAKDFYVSPGGADSNSGSAEAPFKTVVAARDAIRDLSASERAEDINVYLRGGVYPIHETLVFNVQDGAPEGAVVRYRAYEGEEPVLSSGVSVSSWTKLKDAPDALP
ncbi:MAG: right-handed parallel beta-helix repeat-containing protein, partial [Coraliomargarita sp.]|nr:right-handed parallel beta-helix repeat-containing protein [Coraliomargarita sp.]